jgi:NADPH:quinone reductase
MVPAQPGKPIVRGLHGGPYARYLIGGATSMKAVIVKKPGGLEQLVVADLPDAVPGKNEVLIDVAYCGLNWADTMVRVGTYPHPFTYPVIPGLEVTGCVAAIGDGVTDVEPGDRVIGFNEKGGGYADKFVTHKDWVFRLPPGMSFEVGAAFPVQSLTAYHMLHTIARIERGDWILVHAIGGGVGLYCTQLAVKAGAHVIGAVGTPGKEKRALEYGARRVILSRSEDFEAVVMDVTGGKGVDLAIDSLGAKTLDRTFNIVRKLGKVISIGEAEGVPYANIRERLLPRSLTFTRFHLGHVEPTSALWQDGLRHVMSGILDGWLKVPIEQIYGLDQARAMQARIESRQLSGKLLLRVAAVPSG